MKHKPIEVTPHLFQLGTPSFPVYLSTGDESMIIEGGTGATFDIIVSQLDYLGVSPQSVRAIALTHTHADHVGAVPRFRKIWPHIKLIAGSVADKFLKKERFLGDFLPADKMINDLLLEKGDIKEVPQDLDDYSFHADVVLEEDETIDLGQGIRWRILNTPGHAPCQISLLETKEGSLAIGDSTGYYDPDRDVFWPNYFQSLGVYCDSIRKLSRLSANRILISHNGVIQGDSRVYLNKALKATEAYHLEILRRLDKGDDPKQICKDTADWIVGIGALATYDILTFLSKLLLKNSEKERESADFSI
jgi:glyoxylase-like metal-dependent hydrolase (beta-lactamase superfamily II)